MLLAALTVLLLRLTAGPDLGGAPAGPGDGQSPLEIAATLAGGAGVQLTQPGATGAIVVVSEEDLSVLAAAVNPDPASYTDLRVRARAGQLWVTAASRLGPLAVVVTARFDLGFAPGGPITTHLEEIDVGDQAIPGFLRSDRGPARQRRVLARPPAQRFAAQPVRPGVRRRGFPSRARAGLSRAVGEPQPRLLRRPSPAAGGGRRSDSTPTRRWPRPGVRRLSPRAAGYSSSSG